MAATEHYISGTCKWAKVFKPDTKFEPQYSLILYPDDWSEWKEMNLGGRIKEDEDGKFVTLRRKIKTAWDDDIGPPEVVDEKGEPFKELIGNGSKVTVKVQRYDTAKGPGHRIDKVRVDAWVKYEKPPEGDASEDAPEEGKEAPKAAGKPKKGMPF